MRISTSLTFPVLFGAAASFPYHKGLRVETFFNTGPSLDMVSSLIVGSEAAVIIDLPMAIPQAKTLAQWIRNTTDKPLIAAFASHSHPDHYLGNAEFLAEFPEAEYFASEEAAALIQNEALKKVEFWQASMGPELIDSDVTIPTAYNFTLFALPGDEAQPIHLLKPLVGDTIDETIFWIPSISTLIAGDVVYSHSMHLWLADLLTPALTSAWLSTLDLIQSLNPQTIIPGHSLTTTGFHSDKDLTHTREYVEFFQQEIEAKGSDYFTPSEIFDKINSEFPNLLSNTSETSATLLNITAENFGRGGSRQIHYVDLTVFNNTAALEGWKIGHE